jgi:hypothetical protein
MKMRICGDAFGRQTEFTGLYVKEYDPHRLGSSPAGHELNCYLEVTADPQEAKEFSSAAEALLYWRQENGIRPDGKPNRPLTYFSVEIG